MLNYSTTICTSTCLRKKTFKMYMLPKVIIFKDWGSVSASASASEFELMTKLIYVGLNATTVKCLT